MNDLLLLPLNIFHLSGIFLYITLEKCSGLNASESYLLSKKGKQRLSISFELSQFATVAEKGLNNPIF